MKKKALFSILIGLSINVFAQTFVPIGPGNYTNESSSILVDGNDVYAHGFFINGSNYYTYAKYSGGSWNQIGGWGTVFGTIWCDIKINNSIYIGGSFSNVEGNSNMKNIVRYDISTNTLHALGTGLNGWVNTIIPFGNDVIVGGNFTDAGGDSNADFLAKWDGSSWSALSNTVISTNSFTSVNDMIVYNGELYIGGNFYVSGGGIANMLVKWDGTSFQTVPWWNISNGAVLELEVDANNNLYVAMESGNIFKYDGSNLTSLNFTGNIPPGDYFVVKDMAANGTDLYVGGSFLDAMGIADADFIVKYDGNGTWSSVGGGLNDRVNDLEIAGGVLYIAGKFEDAGGNSAADKLVTYNLPGTSGINDLITNLSITIYPNLSQGQFTIQSEKGGVFELMDITGKELNTYIITNNNKQTINENLPAGIYFIREKQSGFTQKIIVQ